MSQAVATLPLKSASAAQARAAFRRGEYSGHTAGLAPWKLQANLAILPETYALDFLRYCQRNPKPCPLVGVTDTGDPFFRTLGDDIDIRTDLPAYNIYRDGELVESRNDIKDLWRDDLVAFALGCSFTFERALIEAGIPLWHVDHDKTVPMYRTTVETRAAGPFSGGMVMSMRAIRDGDIDRAVAISRKYPWGHGGPMQIGTPAAIGIADLDAPDWGDPAPVNRGETPVFWACGVTPQNALRIAKPPLCITHKPGSMLITDVDERAETPFIDPR